MDNITTEVKKLISENLSSSDFHGVPANFTGLDNGKYGFIIDWEKVNSNYIRIAQKNLDIIKTRQETRDKLQSIQVGDYLIRKNGKSSRVTYNLGDSVQDGGGRGSFYLSKSGGASYSGGLDSPVSLKNIQKTGNKKPAYFWIFSQDYSGGNRGVNFELSVNVWEEK